MFERQRIVWLLGRPVISNGVLGWVGHAISPSSSVSINTASELNAALGRFEVGDVDAWVCTSSENLVAALEPDLAQRVAMKVLDLSLVIRVASTCDGLNTSSLRTIDLLADCLSSECKISLHQPLGVRFLEGRLGGVRSEESDKILRALLNSLARRLRKVGEFRRYMLYELPAHRVLLAQSRFRLLVDSEASMTIANDLASVLRASRVDLVTGHALDPMDFIGSFEARRNFARSHLGVHEERLTLGEFREILGESKSTTVSEVPGLVAAYLDNDAARKTLLTLATADVMGCQVIYDSLGTSTGRVVMKSPGVQWLEKRYRQYILPPEGYELRYLDYSCFEPRILAALSGDTELLGACSSDVYERVGDWLGLDGGSLRDLAKAILLRFIYGQSQDRIVAMLSAQARLEPEDARSRLQALEHRLATAFEFRSQLVARARATGYMETRLGNRCLVAPAETYKALSHYLQGTGALIFKMALVEIFGGESRARLIVPMHDAFLCGFPVDTIDFCLRQAIEAMQHSFFSLTGADIAKISVRNDF